MSNLLSIHFGQYIIRENVRPDWLIAENGERLELDFYIEDIGIAIEVQGQQHFVFTPFFHGSYDEFEKRINYDKTKQSICDKREVMLIEVSSESDALDAIEKIKLRTKEKKFVPTDMAGFKKLMSNLGVIKPKAGSIEWRLRRCKRILKRENSGLKRLDRIAKYQKQLVELERLLEIERRYPPANEK